MNWSGLVRLLGTGHNKPDALGDYKSPPYGLGLAIQVLGLECLV